MTDDRLPRAWSTWGTYIPTFEDTLQNISTHLVYTRGMGSESLTTVYTKSLMTDDRSPRAWSTRGTYIPAHVHMKKRWIHPPALHTRGYQIRRYPQEKVRLPCAWSTHTFQSIYSSEDTLQIMKHTPPSTRIYQVRRLPSYPKKKSDETKSLEGTSQSMFIVHVIKTSQELSGNKDCHEFRFSIVRNVTSVSNVTSH